MSQEIEHVKCLIIGSGPAGYTAAIYAARADLKPVLYTGLLAGGQLTQTTEVENYPGYPDGIQGPAMMENFEKQAARLGTDIRFGYVTSVDFSSLPHKVIVDETKTILAETVIISTGASAKWLGLESEQKYNGFGPRKRCGERTRKTDGHCGSRKRLQGTTYGGSTLATAASRRRTGEG